MSPKVVYALDTYTLAKRLRTQGKLDVESLKLEGLYKRVTGHGIANAHDATADVSALAAVMQWDGLKPYLTEQLRLWSLMGPDEELRQYIQSEKARRKALHDVIDVVNAGEQDADDSGPDVVVGEWCQDDITKSQPRMQFSGHQGPRFIRQDFPSTLACVNLMLDPIIDLLVAESNAYALHKWAASKLASWYKRRGLRWLRGKHKVPQRPGGTACSEWAAQFRREHDAYLASQIAVDQHAPQPLPTGQRDECVLCQHLRRHEEESNSRMHSLWRTRLCCKGEGCDGMPLHGGGYVGGKQRPLCHQQVHGTGVRSAKLRRQCQDLWKKKLQKRARSAVGKNGPRKRARRRCSGATV